MTNGKNRIDLDKHAHQFQERLVFVASEDIKAGQIAGLNRKGELEVIRIEETTRIALERIASGIIPCGTCADIAKEALEMIKIIPGGMR